MSKFAEDLVRVAGFLQTLGVAPLRGRLKTYSDVLAAAAKGQPVDRKLLWAAACEVSDLEEITSLSPASMGAVVHRLPGLFGGEPIALAAAGDDAGRSLTFELVTGARLQKIGGTSGFGVPSDVTNQIAGVPLMIECKRPTSLAGMAKRLQGGFRQLSEHRRAGHPGFGVIAIEASALVNPESGVLVQPAGHALSPSSTRLGRGQDATGSRCAQLEEGRTSPPPDAAREVHRRRRRTDSGHRSGLAP